MKGSIELNFSETCTSCPQSILPPLFMFDAASSGLTGYITNVLEYLNFTVFRVIELTTFAHTISAFTLHIFKLLVVGKVKLSWG